jgi:hypothetical protein
MANEKIEPTREKCKVCSGRIVKRLVYRALVPIPRYGNPHDWGWVTESKFCEDCGIKYD